MRLISVAAIALVLAASGALAQNPPANDGPNNKAINSKSGNNPGAPIAGVKRLMTYSRSSDRGATETTGLCIRK
jgi:hypothetical protein